MGSGIEKVKAALQKGIDSKSEVSPKPIRTKTLPKRVITSEQPTHLYAPTCECVAESFMPNKLLDRILRLSGLAGGRWNEEAFRRYGWVVRKLKDTAFSERCSWCNPFARAILHTALQVNQKREKLKVMRRDKKEMRSGMRLRQWMQVLGVDRPNVAITLSNAFNRLALEYEGETIGHVMDLTIYKGGKGSHTDGLVVLDALEKRPFGIDPSRWNGMWQTKTTETFTILDTRHVLALANQPTQDIFIAAWLLKQAIPRSDGLAACTGHFNDARGWKLETVRKMVPAFSEDALRRTCETLGGKTRKHGDLVVPFIDLNLYREMCDAVPHFEWVLPGDVRHARQIKGLSLREAAEHFDVSHQTVRNWETGKSYPPDNAVETVLVWLKRKRDQNSSEHIRSISKISINSSREKEPHEIRGCGEGTGSGIDTLHT